MYGALEKQSKSRLNTFLDLKMHSWGSLYIEIIRLMNLEMEMIIFTSYTKANKLFNMLFYSDSTFTHIKYDRIAY